MDRPSPTTTKASPTGTEKPLPKVVIIVKKVEKPMMPGGNASLMKLNQLMLRLMDQQGREYKTLPFQLERAVRNPEVFVDIMEDHAEFSRLLNLPERWAALLGKMSIKLVEARRLIQSRKNRSANGLLPRHLEEDTNTFCLKRIKALITGCEMVADMIVQIASTELSDDTLYEVYRERVVYDLDKTVLVADAAPSEAVVTRRIARTGKFDRSRIILAISPEDDEEARESLNGAVQGIGDAFDNLLAEDEEQVETSTQKPEDEKQPEHPEEQEQSDPVAELQQSLRERIVDGICYVAIAGSIAVIAWTLFKKFTAE